MKLTWIGNCHNGLRVFANLCTQPGVDEIHRKLFQLLIAKKGVYLSQLQQFHLHLFPLFPRLEDYITLCKNIILGKREKEFAKQCTDATQIFSTSLGSYNGCTTVKGSSYNHGYQGSPPISQLYCAYFAFLGSEIPCPVCYLRLPVVQYVTKYRDLSHLVEAAV